MVQASTYENESFLPEDYIPSLIETYPQELISAYLNGQFVNLTSGTIYKSFDRITCNSAETIQGAEPLYIGQDFNVGAMASVIHVKRGDEFHAVGELFGLLDTPHLIEILKEKYPDNKIFIYPDSSGKNRKSNNASESDISLLKQAGFSVRVKDINPFVRDRVLAMNKALEHGKLRVNTALCPEYTECLEQQAYDKNGEPDKNAGFDHMNDAGGYLIAYEMPVIKPLTNIDFKFTV